MDRSNNEEHEYESYSEDFDQDEDNNDYYEDDDDQDQQVNNHSSREESDEDEIKVYKSLTGPSITIQPHPRKSKLRTPVKTESDGSLLAKNSPRQPLPRRKAVFQKSEPKSGNPQSSKIVTKSNKEACTSSAGNSAKPQKLTTLNRSTKPDIRMLAKTRFAQSFNSLNIAKPGTRRVPGTTNVNNRGYTRNNYQHAVSPYLPPMKLGIAKAPGTVAQRVASAKRMTVNDLKNKIFHMQTQMEELKRENRTLNHMQNRQSQALKKWEGRDAELPRLLQQHKDELRNTQEQAKKISIQCRNYEEKIRNKDKKLLEYEVQFRKLQDLVTSEELQERKELQQNMEIVSMNLSGSEKKIRQYMRHVEILQKNHLHQIDAEKKKHMRTIKISQELRDEISNLKLCIRDKDRMLNYIQMRSTGRNLIRSFQDKERVQFTRYQFPTLASPRSRISDSREDFSVSERGLLASRSLETRRSQPDLNKGRREEYEISNQKSLTGREYSDIRCSNKSLSKIDKDSTTSQFQNFKEKDIDNLPDEADSRLYDSIPSPQYSPDKDEEPNRHSYYRMSQMLRAPNEKDARSSLPPKALVHSRTPAQNKTEKVRKHHHKESPHPPGVTTYGPKTMRQKAHSLPKVKPQTPSKSKNNMVFEYRDENNRKIKHYASTRIPIHTQHEKQNQGDAKTEKSHVSHPHQETHRKYQTNLTSGRQVDFDKNVIPSPHSHSKQNGNREKGLEVRVHIIKTAGGGFESENDSSTSRSSSGASIQDKGNIFSSIQPSPPIAYADPQEESKVYSHRRSPTIKFQVSEQDSLSPQRNHRLDSGDFTSIIKNTCLVSEPEEMVRYHEAAIGDFVASSNGQQHGLVTPRTNYNQQFTTNNISPRAHPSYPEAPTQSTMNHPSPDSFRGGEIPIPNSYASSMPSVASPGRRNAEMDQFGFFSSSPNYPGAMENFPGRDLTYSNENRMSNSNMGHEGQDPSHVGHLQMSPRVVNSYPQMHQNQQISYPQPRGVYSNSGNISPERVSNQPMNLPFFSVAGESRHPDLRQQDYHREVNMNQAYPQSQRGSFPTHHMERRNLEDPCYQPNQNQLPYQNNSDRSHNTKPAYDPSFFTKIGTWK